MKRKVFIFLLNQIIKKIANKFFRRKHKSYVENFNKIILTSVYISTNSDLNNDRPITELGLPQY